MRISSARVFSGPCVAGACVGTRSWGAQRVRGVCLCRIRPRKYADPCVGHHTCDK